ncbi:MAG: right-handed parallel beta-helix repeat-containing protein [Clostridia bacterium]|nr:right-handed parallel beta-helix repeat-containing protein [Clostridia bacterium]
MIAFNEITSLYVSQTGCDNQSGSEPVSCSTGAPFSSIEAALSYVRELRRIGVGQPISIRLAAGEYPISRTIVIDQDVTGITIEPDGDAKVKLIGGRRIEGFRWDEYRGVKCLSADLGGECDFTDFYVNGERAKLTRYPAEGYLYPDDVENHEGQLFSGSRWFIAQEGDIKDFANIERVQISFCHYWIDEHTPIRSYDPETRRVTFEYPSRFNIAGGKGTSSGLEYYLENVAEAFANPGEWYADGGKIYYIPRDESITPETIEAYVPSIHKLFDIHGTPDHKVKNIRLRNLDMGVTRGEYGSIGVFGVSDPGTVRYASDAQAVSQADGSLSFNHASGCSVENCSLTNFGVHGVVIGPGCRNIRLSHMKMIDGGAGGVKIIGGAYGCDPREETFGNTVEDCTILHCGRRYFAACGVLLIHTCENTIAHNEIGYLYYTGVSVGWVWGYAPNQSHDNLITKNHIHHLGDGMLSDMGGVYLLGLQPGTVVSNNVIHDVTSKNYGGWALYTDEGSSYMTLENNICWNTSDNSYHQHYGSMNTVRNNIFAFSGGQMMRVSRTETHLSIIFENNIVYSDGAPMFDISRAQINQKTVSSKRNLYFDTSREDPVMRQFGEEALTLTDLQARGLEHASKIADPMFRDPVNHDFTLLPGSPALAMGFRPIDVSDVGPRA